MIEAQLQQLSEFRNRDGAPDASATSLRNGGFIVTVPEVDIGPGWSQTRVDVLFLIPPGYPAARPDCFWVHPTGLRLADGSTPQNTNDSNAIPGDDRTDRKTTWFSWHLQSWDPNKDTLTRYFNAIMQRLKPAR